MEPPFQRSRLECAGIVSLNQRCKCVCEMFKYLCYMSMKAAGISELLSGGET